MWNIKRGWEIHGAGKIKRLDDCLGVQVQTDHPEGKVGARYWAAFARKMNDVLERLLAVSEVYLRSHQENNARPQTLQKASICISSYYTLIWECLVNFRGKVMHLFLKGQLYLAQINTEIALLCIPVNTPALYQINPNAVVKHNK